MQIETHPDLAALSQRAAQLFEEHARAAIRERGRFLACLSGGTTPPMTYRLLRDTPLDWPRIHLFWGDERCAGEEGNHFLTSGELWHDHVKAVVHPFRDAASYDRHLREFFGAEEPRFDLAFLGLGADGHTASLFPGTPGLLEKEAWAVEHYVPSKGKQRMTLTYPVLERVRQRIFLVNGEGKAAILASVAAGDPHPATPLAQHALFLVDRLAKGSAL